MNKPLAVALLLAGLLTTGQAQQSADEKYAGIYSLLQQAETFTDAGEARSALNKLLEAQAQLKMFKKFYPDWNPNIVTYRQADLAQKIATLQSLIPAPLVSANAMSVESHGAQPAPPPVDDSSSQLEVLQAQNTLLRAKLKEALSAQPATVDAAELVRAQEQIRALTKEYELLKASRGNSSNEISQLHALLAIAGRATTDTEVRLREMAGQRDDLAKQLAAAKEKALQRGGSPRQLAVLTEETKSLQARLAVLEAKPVPYTEPELALLRQPAPAPNSGKKSIHEMPAGSAELVASAQKHFAQQEFDQAEADYRKILERDPKNGLVLANLATIELQENKLVEADQHLQAALLQNPNDAYSLATLGSLKFRQKKYDEALDILSRAAKADPQNAEIQNYLGVTLNHKGLRQPAETALRKAIQLNPGYAPAHNNLAVIYLTQTPPVPLLARWHYQKALDAGQPRNPELEKMLTDQGAPLSTKP